MSGLSDVYNNLLKRIPRLPDKAIWCRQFVTISGLGCPAFDNGIKVMATLYHMFGCKMGVADIKLFTSQQFNGHPAINFSWRYFSGFVDGTGQAMSSPIDPLGQLTKFGKGLHHNAENVVLYCRR